MARHLLDTDVLIWILRGKTEAIDLLRAQLRHEVPAISTLSIYEIWTGARPSEEAAISAFLAAFQIVSVGEAIARQAAQYYKQFRSKGITLSSTDALIAATARVEDLILVTENRRHFPMSDIVLRSL